MSSDKFVFNPLMSIVDNSNSLFEKSGFAVLMIVRLRRQITILPVWD